MGYSAQDIFNDTFAANQGVLTLGQLADAIKSAGNKDTTVTWRLYHNMHMFRYRGDHLVSNMVSDAEADRILTARHKPAVYMTEYNVVAKSD